MLVLCVNSPFEFSTMPMFCKREVASWSDSEFLCSLCLYLGKKKRCPLTTLIFYVICFFSFLFRLLLEYLVPVLWLSPKQID